MNSMIRILKLFFLGLFFVSCQSPKQSKPNVVLILVDDMGWTDLGSFGSDLYQSPNIDALASEGLMFTNSYSSCTVCSPTRGSFLTGRHYARFGIFAANEGVFPAEEISLARICKEKGYQTGHFGKWHIGTLDPNHSPKPDRP